MMPAACTTRQAITVACDDCQEVTIVGELLAKDRAGNVHHEPVLLEPGQHAPRPDPATTQLLHLGAYSSTGAWLVVSMDDPGAQRTAQFLGEKAHCHRPHVCMTIPDGWTAAEVLAGTASAGAS